MVPDESLPATEHNNRSVTSSARAFAKDTTWRDRKTRAGDPVPAKLGDYQLGAEIGRGGMGVVFEANEVGLDRKVAVKILPTSAGLTGIQAERFKIEARAAAQLSHDHIVPVYHIGQEKDTHYYSMKLIRGNDFGAILRAAKEQVSERFGLGSTRASKGLGDSTVNTGPKSTSSELSADSFLLSMTSGGGKSATKIAKAVAEIGRCVASALEHAHDNEILHRDIKPSNLLLDQDNKVWVVDFGLAQLKNAPDLTRTGDLVGTLRYMSPEQASGRRAFVDHRTDIYSLGVTLYEMATLQSACKSVALRDILREITFERPTPVRKLNPRLPRDFETIITKATERNPAERYQKASELAADLERFIVGKPLLAKRPSKLKRTRDWFYDRPLAAVGFAAILLAMIITTGAIAWAATATAAESKKALVTKSRQLEVSESLRLSAVSGQVGSANPGLSLALAVKGGNTWSSTTNDKAILNALDEHREVWLTQLDDPNPGSAVISRDGEWIVQCYDGRFYEDKHTSQVLSCSTGEPLVKLKADDTITSAAFGTDDRQLLTAGFQLPLGIRDVEFENQERSNVRVWATPDFSMKQNLADTYAVELTNSVFSSDGKLAVLPKNGGLASVYETRGWQEIGPVLRGHGGNVIQAIFSPDNQHIATWAEDGLIRLWDAQSGNEVSQLVRKARRPTQVRLEFSQDSKKLLVRGGDGVTCCSIPGLEVTAYESARVAVFSQDSDRVFYGSSSGDGIFSLSLSNDQREKAFHDSAGYGEFLTLDRGEILAEVIEGTQVHLYETATGKKLGECLGHEDGIFSIRPRPNSSQFVTLGWNGTLRLWDTKSDSERRTLSPRLAAGTLPKIVHSDDGKLALVSNVAEVLTTVFESVDSIEPAFSFEGVLQMVVDDKRLITTLDNTVSIWDIASLKRLRQTAISDTGIFEVLRRDSDGALLIYNFDRQAFLTDANLRDVRQLTVDGESINAIAQDSTTGQFFLGLSDGRVESIDPESNQRVPVLDAGAPIVSLAVFEPSHRLLAGTVESEILHWSVQDAKQLSRVSTGDVKVQQVLFANNGDAILTHPSKQPGKLAVWNAETGESLMQFDTKRVDDIVSNDDGTQFVIAAATEGAFVLDLATQETYPLTDGYCKQVALDGERILLATQPARRLTSLAMRLLQTASEQQVENDEELTGENATNFEVWDFATRKKLSSVPISMSVDAIMKFEGSGEVLLSGTQYGPALVDLEEAKIVAKRCDQPVISSFCDFATNEQIVGVTLDGRVLLRPISGAATVEVGKLGAHTKSIALSPDRKILLATGQDGLTYQVDLVARTISALDWAANPASVHTFASDSSTVVTVDGTKNVHISDLRTPARRTIAMDSEVFLARISNDGKEAILLHGANAPALIPAMRQSPKTPQTDGAVDAWWLDLNTQEVQSLEFKGDPIDACFAKDDTHVSVLSSEGTIHIFDRENRRIMQTLQADRPLQKLMPSNESGIVFAVNTGMVLGWDIKSAALVWEVPARIGHLDWDLTSRESKRLTVPDSRRIRIIPTSPLEYARALPARGLTEAEEQKYALPLQLVESLD